MKILCIGSQKFGEQVTGFFSNTQNQVRSITDTRILESGIRKHPFDIALIDDIFLKSRAKTLALVIKQINKKKKPVLLISSNRHFSHLLKMKKLGVADCILKPYNEREFVMRVNAVGKGKKRIVCIGGGTGLFNLLIGLKQLPQVLLTSVVSMSDDGGSSGKLSESLGLLPPGDIRRSLVALSNAPEVMNQIMQYRFEKKGELEGHSFGNIFLAALAGVKGSMAEAVRSLSDILYLQGIVLPVSKALTKLVAQFEDGSLIKGESKIDRAEGRSASLSIVGLSHEPEVEAEPDAVTAILFSDYIVIGPGDLFTSIITNLIITNIREAILHSSATKIYICNLMTKPGETSGLDAQGHRREIVKYLGKDVLDYVLISNTKLSKKAISDYAKKNQVPVNLASQKSALSSTQAKIILADIGDTRELVRHNSVNLKKQIQKIIGITS